MENLTESDRILIVDDDASVCNAITRSLKQGSRLDQLYLAGDSTENGGNPPSIRPQLR